MERALLIMNPEARGVSVAMQRVVEAALRGRFKLDSLVTKSRDSAIEAVREAAGAGVDLMVAFGGDGLVNQVANGIAGTGAALAIVPGGTMNVLARSLGLPNDVLEATDLILRKAGRVEPRSISLGAADGRYFTFACGCGFDADAAARVESHKQTKRRFGEAYFYAAGLVTFFRSYLGRSPFLICRGAFGAEEAVMVVALNSGTYAYLAGRPVRLGSASPGEPTLDLFLLRRLEARRIPTYAVGALLTGRFGANSVFIEGVDQAEVLAAEAMPVHVDGEPLAPVDRVLLRGSRETLKVLV